MTRKIDNPNVWARWHFAAMAGSHCWFCKLRAKAIWWTHSRKMTPKEQARHNEWLASDRSFDVYYERPT